MLNPSLIYLEIENSNRDTVEKFLQDERFTPIPSSDMDVAVGMNAGLDQITAVNCRVSGIEYIGESLNVFGEFLIVDITQWLKQGFKVADLPKSTEIYGRKSNR